MAMKGNKGEWSEVYAFLRLLAAGKLYAADEKLNRIRDMFFPIIRIIREETVNSTYEYFPNHQNTEVEIYLDEELVLTLPVSDFENHANSLLASINSGSIGKGAFEVPDIEAFIRGIFITKTKAKSANTADINIQLHDVHTGYEQVVGFSIKSELGSPPTLLNAGRTTNFIFRVDGLALSDIAEINAIDTRFKIIDRMRAISDKGGSLHFHDMENAVFKENLMMIDSQMPTIVAKMLEGYYTEIANDSIGLTNYLTQNDPLSRSPQFYKHKIKEMLCAIALGMKPATRWDGTDEATGGYIVVKANGDVLAYHIYNRDSFKGYLLDNTKLERGSTSKHDFAILYEQGGQIFIKLNLQIRFI